MPDQNTGGTKQSAESCGLLVRPLQYKTVAQHAWFILDTAALHAINMDKA